MKVGGGRGGQPERAKAAWKGIKERDGLFQNSSGIGTDYFLDLHDIVPLKGEPWLDAIGHVCLYWTGLLGG